MKIRKFKKTDAKDCNKIIYSCLDVAKKMTKKDKAFLKEFYTIENILMLPKISSFFVVENNEKIIGMGRLEKNKIATIYFKPKYQRKGGGSLIMKHLEKLAKKNKIKIIYLESLLQSTGFYENLGFRKIKRLKSPVNSYRMEKRIF